MRVRQGQVVVTFEACPQTTGEGATEFGGGFVISSPECLQLDVTVVGGGKFVLALPAGRPCGAAA